MNDSLEQIVEKAPLTLRQEMAQSIRDYPKTWKDYFHGLAPAVLISSLGAAAGQWAVTRMGYDSKFATTAAAYVCGYIPGYTTFFATEYRRHRENYPAGIFSKEFGEYIGTFLAADYVADLTTFTPPFIAMNLWLHDNTTLHPAVRSLVAWNSAGMLWLTCMAGLHPVTRRINQAINKGVKSLYYKIKGNNSAADTSC